MYVYTIYIYILLHPKFLLMKSLFPGWWFDGCLTASQGPWSPLPARVDGRAMPAWSNFCQRWTVKPGRWGWPWKGWQMLRKAIEEPYKWRFIMVYSWEHHLWIMDFHDFPLLCLITRVYMGLSPYHLMLWPFSPLKYIEMVILGWAMGGQSSGQTHVGIKMVKHGLCPKKWWCKAKIAMISTVYCILRIFYWVIPRTMWMGHNSSAFGRSTPSGCLWQAVKMHIDLDYNERPFYRLGPRGHSHRSVAVPCPGRAMAVPRSALWEATWRNHEAISKWRQMFPGHFLFTYIYIIIYIYR